MDFLNNYFKYDNEITINGLTNSLAHLYVYNLFKEKQENIIVLTSTLYEANEFYRGLKNLHNDTFLFPMDDFLTSQAIAISPELKTNRIETLQNLKTTKGIIITNLTGYLKFLTDAKVESKLNIKLKKGEEINRNKLIELLEELDYKKDTIVTSTGEYAVRGYVIDIFVILSDHPVRLEFFGNTIESIRYFDEETQMSLKEINEINLITNGEIKTDTKSSLYDYAKPSIVVTIDNNRLKASYEKLEEEMFEYRVSKNLPKDTRFMFSFDDINPDYNIYLNLLDNKSNTKNNLNFSSKNLTNFNSDFAALNESTKVWYQKGYEILFALTKPNQKKIIQSTIEVPFKFIDIPLTKGFIFEKYVVITEFDIENITKTEIKYKNSYKIGRKIKDLDALNLGDYVVHLAHGIGIYNGLKTLSQNGLEKDYLEIMGEDIKKLQ